MNLSDPFKQLMERRLWPIALLLVAALAAVPMVLKKSDEGTAALPPAAPVAGAEAGVNPDDSVVTLADAGRTDDVRSVLGDRKDPFRPASIERIKVPKDESAKDAAAAAAQAEVKPEPETTGGGTTDPTYEVPVEPKPTYELYSLVVSFGDATGEQETKVIERLTGMPAGNPAILYLGLLKDHKTAAFIVDDSVEMEGDGKCNPSPEDCQSLTLKVGETEFFTRGDTTYQLDLKKIVTKQTFDKGEAVAARRAIAKGGKSLLRRANSSARSFKYSSETGLLGRVAAKANRSSGKAFAGGIVDSTG